MLRTATHRFRAADIVHNSIAMQGIVEDDSRLEEGVVEEGEADDNNKWDQQLRVQLVMEIMVLITGEDRIRSQDVVAEGITEAI